MLKHLRGIQTSPLVLLACLLVSACTGPAIKQQLEAFPATLSSTQLLTNVPFIGQHQYYCGPAALAMLLQHAGSDVSAEALVTQVYIPKRKGSLQIEMVAATRRNGHIPYILDPFLSAIVSEIDAGHAVLVLQNLGLSWLPAWHYAVVIGYDLKQQQVILHSGMNASRPVAMKIFLRTWQRAGSWAMVITKEGQLPATVEVERYLQAIAEMERQQYWPVALSAYTSVLQRWPKNIIAMLGSGNSHYQMGDYPAAIRAYQSATQIDPESAIAHNNLANALLHSKKLVEAEAAARQAIRLGGPFSDSFKKTLIEIQRQLPVD